MARKSLAAAVDLEDVHSSVHFKLLIELDAHKMACSSTPGMTGHQATWKLDLHAQTTDNRTPTRLSLSPVFYHVYTKGLANLNSKGLNRTLILADNGLIYKTASDTHTAVTVVQEQLEEKVSQWCQEKESEISRSKAQALYMWCNLNNKEVGQAMSAVSFRGEAIERTNSLRYLEIHFDRILMYKMQVESTN